MRNNDNILTLGFKHAAADIIASIIKWVSLGILVLGLVFFLIDYSTTDAIENYTKAAKLMNQTTARDSKERFKQEYLENTRRIDEIFKSAEKVEQEAENTDNPSSSVESSSSPEGISDEIEKTDVYKVLKDSNFSGKAYPLTVAYYGIMRNFNNKNFALGLMANICHEGSTGVIEGIWAYDSSADNHTLHNCKYKRGKGAYVMSYWAKVDCNKYHPLNYQCIVGHPEYVDILLNIPGTIPGIGVGTIQWSGGRRVNLLKYYKSRCKEWTKTELSVVEAEFMLNEFQNDKGHGIPTANACLEYRTFNKSSVQACAKIVTLKYEQPSSMQAEAVKRAETAGKLYDLLKDVK